LVSHALQDPTSEPEARNTHTHTHEASVWNMLCRDSLKKAQVLTIDAAKHKKHRESLSPEQKVHVMTIDAAAHKKQYELPPQRKKQDSWKP
jgi:hypothetical protein